MPSVLAIISKAIFEKEHGRGASPGTVLSLASYHLAVNDTAKVPTAVRDRVKILGTYRYPERWLAHYDTLRLHLKEP